jgi:hypothetical protein
MASGGPSIACEPMWSSSAYDDYGLVSKAEADHAGKLAAQVRKQG